MIISVQNQKGGVGKTATAVSLAAVAQAAGYRALLVDLDPQASATSWLGVTVSTTITDVLSGAVSTRAAVVTARPATSAAPALDLLAADERLIGVERSLAASGALTALRDALAPVASSYDVVLLDSGPSISALSMNSLHAADVVLVPLSLSSLALDGVARLHALVELAAEDGRHPLVRYLPTAADARLRETRDVLGALTDAFGAYPDGAVLPAVRYSSALSRAFGLRRTLIEYAGDLMTQLKGRADPAADRAVRDHAVVLDVLLNDARSHNAAA